MCPLLYDLAMTPCEWLGLGRWRADVVGAAAGHILEIGAGTGRNFPHYRQAGWLVVSEFDPAMLVRARPRVAGVPCPVHLVAADAQRLPFAAATFDAVVVTLAFCTIPEPERALDEIHRVLRPDGRLHLLEHVRVERSWVARGQDALTPLWRRLSGGCHLNRPTLAIAQSRNFVPIRVRHGCDGWLLAAELRRG